MPQSVLGRLGSALGTAVRIGLGATVLFSSPFLPATLGLSSVWVLPSFVLGVALVWAFAGTREYPVGAVGPRRRVRTEPVEDLQRGRPPRQQSPHAPYCDACGTRAEGGIRRQYAREFALLGSPLYTFESGENVYCPECAETVRRATVRRITVPVGGNEAATLSPEPETDPVEPTAVTEDEPGS